MRIENKLMLVLFFLLAACGSGQPDAAQVHAYLIAHPEFVLDNPDVGEAVKSAAEQRRRQAEETGRRKLLEVNSPLIRSVLTPTFGNSNAMVSIIQFSDYQCVPCKKTYVELDSVKNSRNDIEVLYLELPVYGSVSDLAARAAIAANINDVFPEYHHLLMLNDAGLDVARIREVAIAAGMTDWQVENSFNDPEIMHYLAQVRVFAEELDVNGTPTFLIGNQLVRGAVTAPQFNVFIDRNLSVKTR